jgi:hypothetical protein
MFVETFTTTNDPIDTMVGMTHLRATVGGLVLVAMGMASPIARDGQSTPVREVSAPPLIRFSADDLWLDLHHFLYVLGRAQAGVPDALGTNAPHEQDTVLPTLTPDEQARWRDAVGLYAQHFSRLDLVSDPQLVAMTGRLAAIGGAATLDGVGPTPSPEVVGALERVAPAYRRAWWPAHRRANEQWVAETKALVEPHGQQVLTFITGAYQLPWPVAGYPVHVCAYTNWAGAYSTDGPLLVVSSVDAGGDHGPAALETVFHEATHQWDNAIASRLAELGQPIGKKVPDGLAHAMIWMTAGEAVRRVIPGYVPIAEAGGLWERGANPRYRPALEATWLPYLNGKGTRDEALFALMKLIGR